MALASRTQALYQDSAIQDQVDMWKEQLLAGDQVSGVRMTDSKGRLLRGNTKRKVGRGPGGRVE